VQERLTSQVADALMEHLDAHGVAVVMEASHTCMMMRGVQKQNSTTVSSAMRGTFEDDPRTRSEFMSFLQNACRASATSGPRPRASAQACALSPSRLFIPRQAEHRNSGDRPTAPPRASQVIAFAFFASRIADFMSSLFMLRHLVVRA
jgi:hypothetical protein